MKQTFNYPNFSKDYMFIKIVNSFVHKCPFVFEIQTIINWISKKTYVSLSDFFIVNDISLQLEILVADQTNLNKNKDPTEKKGKISGTILLVIMVFFIFGPLFFLSSGGISSSANIPLSAKLEIGLPNLPPFYSSQGSIKSFTYSQQQEISSIKETISAFDIMVKNDIDSLTTIEFPFISYESWYPEGNVRINLLSYLNSQESIEIYYKYTIYFPRPTSLSSTQEVVFQHNIESDEETVKELIRQLSDKSTMPFTNISLPVALIITTDDLIRTVIDNSGYQNLFGFSYSKDDKSWVLSNVINNYPLTFIRSDSSYNLLLYSQFVNDDNSSLSYSAGGIVGIYLIIVIIFGFVLRTLSNGHIDSLWLDRMHEPQKLYRMIVVINAFRSANEKEIVDMLSKIVPTFKRQENKSNLFL